MHVDDEKVQRSVVPVDLFSKATKAALKQHGTTMGSPQMVRGEAYKNKRGTGRLSM